MRVGPRAWDEWRQNHSHPTLPNTLCSTLCSTQPYTTLPKRSTAGTPPGPRHWRVAAAVCRGNTISSPFPQRIFIEGINFASHRNNPSGIQAFLAAVSQANICILLGLTWCLDTHTQYNYIQCGYFSTLLRENVRCRTVLTLTNQHPTTNSSWHLCCDIRKHEGGQVTCSLLKRAQKPRLEICWKATESFVDSRNATDKCLDLLLLVLDILKVKDLCKHYILK